jgi:hypothetical protein
LLNPFYDILHLEDLFLKISKFISKIDFLRLVDATRRYLVEDYIEYKEGKKIFVTPDKLHIYGVGELFNFLKTLIIEDGNIQNFNFVNGLTSLKELTILSSTIERYTKFTNPSVEKLELFRIKDAERIRWKGYPNDEVEMSGYPRSGLPPFEFISGFVNLRSLILRELEGVNSLDVLTSLKELKTLIVEGCILESIHPLVKLDSLKKLRLSRNLIEDGDFSILEVLSLNLLELHVGINVNAEREFITSPIRLDTLENVTILSIDGGDGYEEWLEVRDEFGGYAEADEDGFDGEFGEFGGGGEEEEEGEDDGNGENDGGDGDDTLTDDEN